MDQRLQNWRARMEVNTSDDCMERLLLPGHIFCFTPLCFLSSFLCASRAEESSQCYEKGYWILQVGPIFFSPLVQQVGNNASVFKLISLVLCFNQHSKKIQVVVNLYICLVITLDILTLSNFTPLQFLAGLCIAKIVMASWNFLSRSRKTFQVVREQLEHGRDGLSSLNFYLPN